MDTALGTLWRPHITKELRAATVVIAVGTRNLLKSSECISELDQARELGKLIVPLQLERDAFPAVHWLLEHQSMSDPKTPVLERSERDGWDSVRSELRKIAARHPS